MYILGLTAYSHDSSSCLIEDGKVIFQVDEERFDRVKHSSAFPINAINACLNFKNLTIEDIDKITFFWKLINEFKKITGISVLLNTSFNENEPIVNTPQEAIDCFLRNEMDVLVIGSYIITKN